MMYTARRRRFPISAWLIPLCIALIVAGAMVMDYTHEHVHVSVFGQSIDAMSVRQVMIEPTVVQATSGKTYTVNGHQQIIQMLQVLGKARPLHTAADAGAAVGQVMDQVYIELDSGTLQVTLLEGSTPQQLLVDYQNQLFSVDNALLTTLQPQA